jgi:4-cresol dehydrogenase (hydroxylating)
VQALRDWRHALGDAAVLEGPEAARRYGADTSRLRRRIPAALLPANVEEVQAVVQIARRHGVPLYPISTGRNWGHGTANPAVDDSVVVDLSGLRRIVAMDEELGLVTVEPGVTQGQLRAFLAKQSLPFMVPVTGAGPSCSLVGNALERGYGPAPHADHFAAVMALEAVLPTGELYRSPFLDSGGPAAEAVFKWGVGPYLDGLFSQGSFGIVTRMTLALARRPETVAALFFEVERDEQLEPTVAAVREIFRQAQSNVGTITLLSQVRILASMGVEYPRERAVPGGALTPDEIAALARSAGASAWAGAVPVYGTRAHAAATRELVERLLGPHAWRLTYVESDPEGSAPSPLDLTEGRPSELSLLRPRSVRSFVDLVRRECGRHGLEAPITLVGLSERAFDCPLALLFARDDPEESARAEACYRALFAAGREQGLVPYRLGVQFMSLLVDPEKTGWQMGSRLKRALDPEGILAPGRYCLPDPP